jgi:hypothetical protein
MADCGKHDSAGTLIIANVPLPPDVYRELKRQAVVSNQTIAQLN